MARDEMDASGEVLLVLELVRDVSATGIAVGAGGGGNDGVSFRKDCTDLVRKISLLAHLLEEIREFRSRPVDVDVESESESESSWSSDLVVALRAAKRLLSLAGNFSSKSSSVSFMVFFVYACDCM